MIDPLRHPEQNPSVHSESLATLLWRDEILGLLDRYQAIPGFRKKSRFLIV